MGIGAGFCSVVEREAYFLLYTLNIGNGPIPFLYADYSYILAQGTKATQQKQKSPVYVTRVKELCLRRV